MEAGGGGHLSGAGVVLPGEPERGGLSPESRASHETTQRQAALAFYIFLSNLQNQELMCLVNPNVH